MKQVAYIVCSFFMLIVASCSSTKKLQQQAPITTNRDTAVVTHDTLITNIDTLANAKNIIEGLVQKRISFNTFNAKVDVTYKDNELDEDATLNIRMRQDSIIWFSLTGPFGIEGLRAIITKDSVHIINRLDKEVQHESISYLSNILKIPVTIGALQDIVLGNPVFAYNVTAYQVNNDKINIQTAGQLLTNMLTLQNSDYKLLHSKMIERDANQFRALDLDYSNYKADKGISFAKQRTINVTGVNMLQVLMDFKQYNFDQPQSYPFDIPKNYPVK